ncbi:MAG TPA: M15 family metallopeptidase [Pseudolabrys sp.]|nr:M15 family metallopeptidase [Pseudolabrys sp.]
MCGNNMRRQTLSRELLLRLLPLLLTVLLVDAPASARDMLAPGFVYLRDVDSSIVQDIRYASHDNFTGHPLPGYGAPECVLRREAAEALKHVQADLARQNLGLKVYDCYRPIRASRAMTAWAHDGSDEVATRRFYPALHKRSLFALGFIAARSRHSTGTAVDLTLVRLPVVRPPRFDPIARYGPCTGPADQRAPDNSVDMGTSFDCFDTRSYGANTSIAPEQRQWRLVLQSAMRRHGFANYFREWWHYSFYGAPEPRAYDFAIAPRGR